MKDKRALREIVEIVKTAEMRALPDGAQTPPEWVDRIVEQLDQMSAEAERVLVLLGGH
jgi:hypothetical protein